MLENNNHSNSFKYLFDVISHIQLQGGLLSFVKKETKFKKLIITIDDEKLIPILLKKPYDDDGLPSGLKILFEISDNIKFNMNQKEISFKELREENQQQIINNFEGQLIERL